MPDQYFIKDGYQAKDRNITSDRRRSEKYWYDPRIGVSRFYQYAVYQWATRLVHEHDLKSVIDIGCGPAYKLMKLLKPICPQVVGVDQADVVDYCRQKYSDGVFVADDLEDPKAKFEQPFDLIICSDVIEHLREPDRLLSHIKTLSHKNTWIIFSTPERDLMRGLDNFNSPNPEHVREWNTAEFQQYLTSRGFEVVQTKILPSVRFNPSLWYLRERLNSNIKHCLTVVCKFGPSVFSI